MKANVYESEIKKLFNDWKKKANATPFVTDGVMNPKEWFSQDVRPLFLLKEAYGGDCDWDLAKDHVLTREKARPIWKRISLWTKGIMNTGAAYTKPFKPNSEDIKDFNNLYLNKIAAVNIKKYNGKKQSDYNEILSYAKNDKDFLRKQIELCDPTVIVCGYTGAALEMILDTPLRKNSNYDLFYFTEINGHSVTVIDYWHPSNHYPEIMNYYCLIEVYQRSLRKMIETDI